MIASQVQQQGILGGVQDDPRVTNYGLRQGQILIGDKARQTMYVVWGKPKNYRDK